MTACRQGLAAQEIADHTSGRIEGNASRMIRSVETVDNVTPDRLMCVGSPEYASRAAASKAGVILMSLEGDTPAKKTVIRVADPDLALCEVLKMIAPRQDAIEPGAHPPAVLGEGAVVDGTAIGPNVVVGEGAMIARGTTLYPGVFAGRGSRIGLDCALWPNVVVREHFTIGERVVIHANSTLGAASAVFTTYRPVRSFGRGGGTGAYAFRA